MKAFIFISKNQLTKRCLISLSGYSRLPPSRFATGDKFQAQFSLSKNQPPAVPDFFVGVLGLEPRTSRTRSVRPSQLGHTPRIKSKIKILNFKTNLITLVGAERLELSWVAPYAPEAYASANFATRP